MRHGRCKSVRMSEPIAPSLRVPLLALLARRCAAAPVVHPRAAEQLARGYRPSRRATPSAPRWRSSTRSSSIRTSPRARTAWAWSPARAGDLATAPGAASQRAARLAARLRGGPREPRRDPARGRRRPGGRGRAPRGARASIPISPMPARTSPAPWSPAPSSRAAATARRASTSARRTLLHLLESATGARGRPPRPRLRGLRPGPPAAAERGYRRAVELDPASHQAHHGALHLARAGGTLPRGGAGLRALPRARPRRRRVPREPPGRARLRRVSLARRARTREGRRPGERRPRGHGARAARATSASRCRCPPGAS